MESHFGLQFFGVGGTHGGRVGFNTYATATKSKLMIILLAIFGQSLWKIVLHWCHCFLFEKANVSKVTTLQWQNMTKHIQHHDLPKLLATRYSHIKLLFLSVMHWYFVQPPAFKQELFCKLRSLGCSLHGGQSWPLPMRNFGTISCHLDFPQIRTGAVGGWVF